MQVLIEEYLIPELRSKSYQTQDPILPYILVPQCWRLTELQYNIYIRKGSVLFFSLKY